MRGRGVKGEVREDEGKEKWQVRERESERENKKSIN